MVDVAIAGVMLAACSFYTANIQQCLMEGGFCVTLSKRLEHVSCITFRCWHPTL
jgi:hypothetical protein